MTYRQGKTADADKFREAGAEPVEADIQKPETLLMACVGVDVVVCAVQGDASVVVDGQRNLIRAADAAGVRRMIPSDFAIDLTKLDDGDNAFLDLRRQADREFNGKRVQPTPVLQGAFMEMLAHPQFGPVDWKTGTFRAWGDGKQACDFTTVLDTGRYTAAAALDEGLTGRPLRIAGTVATMREVHAAFEHASNRSLDFVSMGSIDDLKGVIDQKKAAGASVEEYIMLQYQWCMLSGKAKLNPLDNSRYPDIQPTGIEEYLRANLPAEAQ